ncbi:threonine synthase [Chengkuizengella axinellae]|uniref:Threonine synthase n=1 Tax=Chengkuizengella axinellae TaxID=3064388 RepID=A0ABT9J181_9BACL|nr:threonine synthase [Chengkuizengella sp. 2205SS18-9]MDP5275381.1 threonine synthase [Chengkuizengella sp. 2205SS18-9]
MSQRKPSSFVSHLECPKCNKTYSVDEVNQLCDCGTPGTPLLVRYDLKKLKTEWSKSDLLTREPSLWRYRELLPVKSDENVVSLGEGMTPLIPLKKLGEKVGMPNLLLKDEGTIPSGCFKARGAAVGISKAKELGIKSLAMPTNGNAGGAWSLYAARAGIEANIVMPIKAPKITRSETAIAGAKLYLVDGLISDAGKIVGRAVQKNNFFDASTLKEPYRIEGKKTMGLEIAEQLDWEVPDVILYPTGGGVGIIGIYKGLKELQEIGWIGEKMPRLVAVQATGCAPIVKAWEENKKESDMWEDADTLAFGINVPKAIGDFLVLESIYETDGCAVAIDDETIVKCQEEIASIEGLFVCPEGAANLAAAKKLREDNWIKEEEKVVLLNTGAGIKYPYDPGKPAILQPDEDI